MSLEEDSSNPASDVEVEDQEQGAVEEEYEGEEEQVTEEKVTVSSGTYNAERVNEEVFEELVLDHDVALNVQTTWSTFLGMAESREAAGEAIYAALFDAAPSLQGLFKTPRAIMAMRFMNGLSSIIGALRDPKGLKIIVETLGFQHLDLEVTTPRVIIFRDAILDLLQAELGQRLSGQARAGLATMLNYVGGAYIFIRAQFSVRLKVLISSWAAANGTSVAVLTGQEGVLVEEDEALAEDEEGGRSSLELTGKKNKSGSSGEKNGISNTSVPKTFRDMFMFNTAVMGFSSDTWMTEVLNSFETIVLNVANSFRLQEECDVVSLRIAKCKSARSTMNLGNFKAVMLASLRSLVKDWGSDHEVAWSWLWENVERMLKALVGKPAVQEMALSSFLASLDDTALQKVRREVYSKFFVIAPAGQDYFKQSTTRLHFIADKVVAMSLDMYKEPDRMVEEISALGLRHVGFGIPTDLFGPFVTACVQVIRSLTDDDNAEAAFRWSLSLVSRILQRVINEGSTIVMKAINLNSAKQIVKAVSFAPRGKRALWMLNIQVGTQSISPLYWSLESGALEAAGAIISDLLTIRADRDRYYYAADELFTRHPDIVYRLCTDGRILLSTLFDGLVWRSRVADGGRRRVNYFIKHLLVDSEGRLNEAMSDVQELQDPKIVCHEVLVFLSDLVWGGPVFYAFVSTKLWVLFTFLLYLTAQSVLSQFGHNEEGQFVGDVTRSVQLGLRLFVYTFCMGQLAIYHVSSTVKACRKGALTSFGRIPIPEYLFNFQEYISLVQCIVLIWMLSTCPKLYCLEEWEGKYEGAGVLSDHCPGADMVRPAYGVFSAIVMMIFFLRMLDLAVLDNTLSAYIIIAGRVLKQVMLFAVAMAFVTLAFACSVTALMESDPLFKGIPEASLSYFMIGFHMFDPIHFEQIKDAGLTWIFITIACFVASIDVFLINLLIAQICSEQQAIYHDMAGYARLRRISCIYYTMPYVGKKRWLRWIHRLELDNRLEFNEGDVGLAGGIQVTEPANLNPTLADSITRFGGSTSVASPWPEIEDSTDKDSQGIERLEKIMQRIQKRLEGSKSGTGSGVSGSEGHTSTLQSGSAHSE